MLKRMSDKTPQCKQYSQRFAEMTEQPLISKLMAVSPIMGPNDTNGYLLIFNISGRPKYCLSIENKTFDSTEEV